MSQSQQSQLKIRLNRVDFLNAWQMAERSSSSKSTVSAVNGILVKATAPMLGTGDGAKATLEATDFKTSIRCEATGVEALSDGVAVLPVRLIGEFLKKIPSDTVDIEVKDNHGTLSAGRNRARFTTAPVDDFPKIPHSEDEGAEVLCSVLAQDLSRVLTRGGVASALPAEFPKYLGTCLLRPADGTLTVVSTDSKRLSLAKCPCELSAGSDDGISDLLLPVAALKELNRLLQNCQGEETRVEILRDAGGALAWFKMPGVEFSIRRVESSFPNYERILTSKSRTKLSIQRTEILRALERIDIVSKETVAHLVALNLKPSADDAGGELKMTSKAPDLGTALEILDADVSGEPLRVGFNVGYLLDGLRAFENGAIAISFNGDEGQARVTLGDDEDFLYMLMPARLGPQDYVEDEPEPVQSSEPEVQSDDANNNAMSSDNSGETGDTNGDAVADTGDTGDTSGAEEKVVNVDAGNAGEVGGDAVNNDNGLTDTDTDVAPF